MGNNEESGMDKAKIHGLMPFIFTIFLLGGCVAGKVEYAPPAPEEPIVDSDSPPPVETEVKDGKLVVPSGGNTGAAEMLNGVFYFDFDQAIVKRTNHAELNKHAHALSSDSSLRIRLEGHADERGTREYNLALGERRAIAVGAYLIAKGVTRAQFEVISYGEEKPVGKGQTEAAWTMNRRVEIVYR